MYMNHNYFLFMKERIFHAQLNEQCENILLFTAKQMGSLFVCGITYFRPKLLIQALPVNGNGEPKHATLHQLPDHRQQNSLFHQLKVLGKIILL